MKTPIIFALTLLIGAAAHAQNAPLRTLIISGGPNFNSNQYAIESNARYVEKLTEKSSWRRVTFADGRPNSRTIAAVQTSPAIATERVLSWILQEELPDPPIVAQASTLRRIDADSTKPSVTKILGEFAQPAPDERGLLYFTGHGNAGGTRRRPDYQNTTFALWNNEDISEREVADSIRAWPARNPLFVVAVQCHSGGFANLIFEDGDPQKPLADRDIAGFFSSTGQRVAAGCTPEVNERDYQDFTTHFFAALSGVSRDGRAISGADSDGDGTVSGSEAFAYANIHDLSIDVPVATSDAYLRSVYADNKDDWQKTPYSQIVANAQLWQKAMLNQLSSALNLTGETRVADAMATRAKLRTRNAKNDYTVPGVDEKAVEARIGNLKSQIERRFPGIKAPTSSDSYRAARRDATQWLTERPTELKTLSDALNKYQRASGNGEVKVAMLERFVRGAYTIILQNKLRAQGTPAQQAAFNKLRNAEARNPIK